MVDNQNKHSNSPFGDEPVDDYNVLNYLLSHVRGLSPSSLASPIPYEDGFEME